MDHIYIREFRCEAWIGVYDWEQLRPQVLEFDIDVGLSDGGAARTDALSDTIDYGEVIRRVQGALSVERFHLLEALAERVADIVLALGAPWARVHVSKVHHLSGVKRMGIAIHRHRVV